MGTRLYARVVGTVILVLCVGVLAAVAQAGPWKRWIGMEGGVAVSRLVYSPADSHVEYGWATGPELAIAAGFVHARNWGVDFAAGVSARGGVLDPVRWESGLAKLTTKHRYATMRSLAWKGVGGARVRPRVGAGLEVGYLLRSEGKVEASNGAALVKFWGLADLDLGPVLSLGLHGKVGSADVGLDASYVQGLLNLNDGLNRSALKMRNRSIRMVLRVAG